MRSATKGEVGRVGWLRRGRRPECIPREGWEKPRGRQGDEGGRLAALDVLPESSRAGRETGWARVVAGREERPVHPGWPWRALQQPPRYTGHRAPGGQGAGLPSKSTTVGSSRGGAFQLWGTRGRAWGKCRGLEPGRGAGVTLRARRPGDADATSVVGTLTSRRRESSVCDPCRCLPSSLLHL